MKYIVRDITAREDWCAMIYDEIIFDSVKDAAAAIQQWMRIDVWNGDEPHSYITEPITDEEAQDLLDYEEALMNYECSWGDL